MSQESGSERTQRTVAELLAQYGGTSNEGGQRRRRRRAEDSSDTAPQTIINRVLSDSGRLLPVREDEHRSAHSPNRRSAPQRPPTRYQDPPSGYSAQGTGYQDPSYQDPSQGQQARPGQDAAAETRYLPPTPNPDGPATEQIPRIPGGRHDGQAERPGPPRGQEQTGEDWFATDTYPGMAHTQSIPPAGSMDYTQAIPPAGSLDYTQAMPPTGSMDHTQAIPPAGGSLEETQGHPGPYVDDGYDADGYPGEDYRDEDFAGPGSGEMDRYIEDGVADDFDAEEELREADRQPVKEWLVMVGQLAAGVVGGAALWLVFEWLWRTLPAGALAAAVAVTVGLVLIVRRIRRADDLQTTVLAVLVGLVVTVSPAALLLLSQ